MPQSFRFHFGTLVYAILMGSLSGENLVAQDSTRDSLLSITQLQRIVSHQDWVLVDTRATDAYNGWALDGVKRGGHIPGAVDFPASWINGNQKENSVQLAAALQIKGIERDKNIVLCSSDARDRCQVAAYLQELGFHQLFYFDFNDWAADETKPLIRYPNYQLLVPAAIVKSLLQNQLPETFENATRVKFVEVSWGPAEASYLKGHVPRSFHVNTDHFEPPPAWMLGSPDVLEQFATKYGFQVDDTVIISGEDPTACYRLAIVLRYIGIRDVRVLNGGFAAWQAAGFVIETTSHAPPKPASFDATIPGLPKMIDDVAGVKAGLRQPNQFLLIDTRTWAEFCGNESGYTYHVHKGRIPGSIYGQADFTGTNSLAPYRNIDNTMRNADEILAIWKQAGIHTDKHLSFMCGSGWRAAEVLTFAHVMGIANTSLYSDGWIGWSNDSSNPIEQDQP